MTDRLLSGAIYAVLGQRIDAAMIAMNQTALSIQVEVLRFELAGVSEQQKGEFAKTAKLIVGGLREVYLNAMDALCTAVVRGEVPFEHVEEDHGTSLLSIAEEHAEKLGEGHYPNIMNIIDRVRAKRDLDGFGTSSE